MSKKVYVFAMNKAFTFFGHPDKIETQDYDVSTFCGTLCGLRQQNMISWRSSLILRLVLRLFNDEWQFSVLNNDFSSL